MDIPLAKLYQLLPILKTGLLVTVGMLVAALIGGGLITLGTTCIFLLSPDGANVTRRKQWQAYIVVLLLANVGYQVAYFLESTYGIIYGSDSKQVSRILAIVCSVSPALIVSMTDGVFVWRCYMVRKALGSRSRIHDVVFIFPLCLWIITIVTGTVGGAFYGMAHLNTASTALQTTAISSNILLNLYTTIYTTVCVLLHRRMVIACVGKAPLIAKHLWVVSILLESAAINIPITIAGAIGIAVNRPFGGVIVFIAVACQSFASVLILLQVALGRAIGQQGRVETEEPIESRGIQLDTPSISGSSV